MTRWITLFAAAALLAACNTTGTVSEMPAAVATPAAAGTAEAAAGTAGAAAAAVSAEPTVPLNEDGVPLERHEANAQCWMRYDRSGASEQAKLKLIEKCANDKMAGIDSKDAKDAKKKPAR